MRQEEEKSPQQLFMEMAHIYFAKLYTQVVMTGVHPGQVPMLRTLERTEGIIQRELAIKLHIKPPTVAVTLKRMEKNELIERRPDQRDQRVLRVFLTEKGRDRAKQIAEIMEQSEREMFAGFGDAELCLIDGFFHQIIGNLERTMPKEPKDCELHEAFYRKKER